MQRSIFKATTPNGRYCTVSININNALGSGGYATVYAGKAVDSQEDLAIKLITVKNQFDWEHCEKELDIMTSLTSPNAKYIMQLYGYFNDDDYTCIVMSRAANGVLSDWLTGIKPGLLPQQQIEVMYGIAYGLAYMHSKNILHCDIKPANILLDARMQPMLCDFGLSMRESIDSTNGVAGTLFYFAPELLLAAKAKLCSMQANGKFPYTKQTDIYSFSLLCYCIMAKKGKPFNHISMVGNFEADLNALSDWVVDKNERDIIPDQPQCPQHVAEMIDLGWSADPEKRPTAVQALERLRDETNENMPKFPNSHYNTMHTVYKPKPPKKEDIDIVDGKVMAVKINKEGYKSRCRCQCSLF